MKYFFFHTKRSSFHGPEEDSLKKTLNMHAERIIACHTL
jgi:hypothetical protein